MTTATQSHQWLLFADAVAALDAEGYRIARGGNRRVLRYLWEHRQRLDCAACFRKLGGRLLVDTAAVKAWREGTGAGAVVRHG